MTHALATPAGTAAFAAGFAHLPGAHRDLDGLRISSLGLGTYLGRDTPEDDERTIEAAHLCLHSGVNLLDTAINYRAQRSERALGRALAPAVLERLGLSREQIVVCTKAGFLPHDGTFPREGTGPATLRRVYLDSGIVPADQLVAGCHCLHPAYLRDQLQRSLHNLRLAAVDIFYLHNPETQLGEVSREEFERRLRAAFALCEALCEEGLIGRYGVATWDGLRAPLGAPGHLSLQRLCALATEVAGPQHHLRVVQLPLNLAMTEALSLRNQPVGGQALPLVQAAARLGIAVVASGPLLQGKVVARPLPERLQKALPGLHRDGPRALHFVRSAPGISAVLCGMKAPAHVQENLAVLQQAPLSAAEFVARFGEAP